QNNFKVSGGLVFRFAYPSPPPPPPRNPPTATCSATPTSVIAGSGDTVSVRADASSPDNSPLPYAWSATGGTVEGTGPPACWNPGNSAPGKYTITAKVDDARGLSTSCSADVEVQPKPNRPPTMTCAAATKTVAAGQRVQISANASDPDNDPLTFTWTASGGKVVGTGAAVEFDSTGAQPGHYTVSGQVSDGRGGTANCTVELDVQIPVEQKQLEQRLSLHS